jgi:sugar (pentulose or hexulose) kinase
MTDVFIGLDLGTTRSKALVRTAEHRDVAFVDLATPWQSYPDGTTQTSAETLLELATQLIGDAVHRAESAIGPVHASGIGVTGMAESGVLLDASGRPATPVIAWFDRRGEKQADRIALAEPDFAAAFERTTGLPWNCQATITKLIWLKDNGTAIRPGARWLSVPEWVVYGLGGEQVREPSLASRTGLIDQDTGQLWSDGLAAANLPPSLLPEQRAAGQPAGWLQSGRARTALTVAGHDHPVAALGVGAVGADELFNSSGTADVVARSVPGGLTEAQRAAVVAAGWSAGRHVLPDTTLLLAGVRGGLLLRRVLGALGADSPDGRAALDSASLTVTALPPGLQITGAGRTGNDVMIRLQDDASPAAIWAAATRYTAAETRALISRIEPVVGPHSRAVASGGWVRMDSVRAAKRSVIDHLTFSPVTEPGVTGAALLAAHAATAESVDLVHYVAHTDDVEVSIGRGVA